ncbi:unnamed protein product [Rhizopus microsporus]
MDSRICKRCTKSLPHVKKSKDDEVIITSDKTRSQSKNVQDCYDKLVTTIKQAVAVPKEPDEATLRRVKQLQDIQNKNRLEIKKRISQKKSERRSKGADY